MNVETLKSKVKAAYSDIKDFSISTYHKIKSDRKKSIIAVAVSATLAVGLLSLMLSSSSDESTRAVVVKHDNHSYYDNAVKTPAQTSTEDDVTTNESPLGNGDAIDGQGIQTQYNAYIVGEKESLYSIAKKIYGSSHYWVLIYERNKHLIKDPDLIFAGQEIEIPYRADGNLSWDREELVENYIEIYKTYRKNEKLSEVYWLLYTAVKRIDPLLLDHYKDEVKKFDRSFARGEATSGLPPENGKS